MAAWILQKHNQKHDVVTDENGEERLITWYEFAETMRFVSKNAAIATLMEMFGDNLTSLPGDMWGVYMDEEKDTLNALHLWTIHPLQFSDTSTHPVAPAQRGMAAQQNPRPLKEEV